MTARLLASLALALGLTLSGCTVSTATKDTDATTDNPGDDDDTTLQTAETGDDDDDDTSPYFDVYYFTYEAQFAYNQASGTVEPVGSPYGDIPPTVDLKFGLQEWEATGFDDYATDMYCVISMDLTGGVDNPAWVTNRSFLYYGVDYDGGYIYTDCTATYGKEMDPYYWGTPDELISYTLPYGAATGDWSAESAQFFQDYYPDYYSDPTFFGGAMEIGLLSYNLTDSVDEACYGFAAQVDANFDLVLNGGYLVPMDKATVTAGGNVSSGYFREFSLYLWSFQ